MPLDKDKVEVYQILSDIIIKCILAFFAGSILVVGFGFFVYFLVEEKFGSASGIFLAESGFYLIVSRTYKHYFYKKT
ncbi:MAG: hypothetical protein PSV36_05920 [Algoriphagus sp.]|nr:hypothetical protein [Algoriphagus sp.]